MDGSYKQINCLTDLVYLIHIYKSQTQLLNKLDKLLMLILENNILCYGTDLIILSEKIEQISGNHDSTYDLLSINGSPVGILDFTPVPFNNTKPQKIHGLFKLLNFLFNNTDDDQAQSALRHITQELISARVNDADNNLSTLIKSNFNKNN